MSCKRDIGRGATFAGEEVSISESCFKLHETDWLEGLRPLTEADDIFEVRFKNTRRGYYKNANGLELRRGDVVAVESSPGHDIGIISLTGDMVARQMRRTGFVAQNGEYRKIYRKAKPYDIEKWQEAIGLEHETMIKSRQIASDMGLNMKIGDVEYQGDRLRAIFYYIADERVDFRELIKVFAERFRIRVEMKQIGARQEAGRIGGLGACGRELCCASWVANFNSVTTNAARVQDLSLNPQKLAGQCSKLKCCLVYELDDYIDARREFPRINQPLQALDGDYFLVKTDILRRRMSFSTSPTAMVGVVTLPLWRVREILDANKKGKKVDRLEDDATVEAAAAERAQDPGFVNMVGEESITRFDRSGGAGGGSRRGGSRGGSSRGGSRGDGSRDSRAEGSRGDKPRNDARPPRADRPRGEGSPRNGAPQQSNGQPRNDGGQPRNNANQPRNNQPRTGGESGQQRNIEGGGQQRNGGEGGQQRNGGDGGGARTGGGQNRGRGGNFRGRTQQRPPKPEGKE